MFRRLLPIALGAAVLCAAAFGAAATLPTNTSHLSSGGTTVADCDTGGITVTYVGAPSTVTAVSITNLSPACNGGVAHVTVDDGAGGNVASGSASVSSGSASVTITPNRPAEVVRRWRVVVVTP